MCHRPIILSVASEEQKPEISARALVGDQIKKIIGPLSSKALRARHKNGFPLADLND
jgi:hypothetical protein